MIVYCVVSIDTTCLCVYCPYACSASLPCNDSDIEIIKTSDHRQIARYIVRFTILSNARVVTSTLSCNHADWQEKEQRRLHIEEEHRVAYVAVTRARDRVYMTCLRYAGKDGDRDVRMACNRQLAQARRWPHASFSHPAEFLRRVKALGLPHCQVSTCTTSSFRV